MTASASAQSATLRAMGPTESSVQDSGKAPSVGTRWRLGLKPTMPQSAAGTRVEPPVSEPIEISHMPSAAATAPPEEEPPGMRARSAGLPGVPKCGLAPTPEKANSVMLVLATMTAPALRRRRTMTRVFRGRLAFLGDDFGAGAGDFAGDVEQVLDGDDGAVERPERDAGLGAGVGGFRRRVGSFAVDGEAGARALAVRVVDAGERGVEAFAGGHFCHLPKPPFCFDEFGDFVDALPRAQIGHHEGASAPHLLGVALHHFKRGADVRREIDLVDDQQIGARDAGAALGRDLVAGGDVDDVDGEIGELGRKGGGEIVAARIRSAPGRDRETWRACRRSPRD